MIEQALATLETCVRQRWKVLPADQRENIKSYIVSVIVRCDSSLSPIPKLGFLCATCPSVCPVLLLFLPDVNLYVRAGTRVMRQHCSGQKCSWESSI